MKAVLGGKFMAMNAQTRKTEQAQINNLMLHLKVIEKQAHTKSRACARKKIIKIKTATNKMEMKNKNKIKSIQRINK